MVTASISTIRDRPKKNLAVRGFQSAFLFFLAVRTVNLPVLFRNRPEIGTFSNFDIAVDANLTDFQRSGSRFPAVDGRQWLRSTSASQISTNFTGKSCQ
jgi:hypothetical protein